MTTTSSIGIEEISENSATKRTCNRPVPCSPLIPARLIATRLPMSASSAIAGTRLPTSSVAVSDAGTITCRPW